MVLVGLTGGIGAGKSTALRCFDEFGAEILDADSVVHELYAPGSHAAKTIFRRWGDPVLNPDGSVNRSAVAARVFSSRQALQWLNDLLHPLVKQRIEENSRETSGTMVVGVPLLYEVGWETEFDCTVSVWCRREIQRMRLRERGWGEAEIVRRERFQLAPEEKLRRAEFGIINNGSMTVLREQCRRIYEEVGRPAV